MASPKGYSRVQIGLHWGIALLILFQLIFGEDMTQAWDTFQDGAAPVMSGWVWAHIVVGVAVLVFAAWRLAVRFSRGVPDAPAGLSKMMVLSGEIGHWALYALMFIAPITGLAAWYGGIGAAGELHGWLKPVIIILVVVHIAAALWHQFIRKDGLLMRMKKAED